MKFYIPLTFYGIIGNILREMTCAMKLTKKQTKKLLSLLVVIILAIAARFGSNSLDPAISHTYTSQFTMTVLELDKADCILLEYQGAAVLVDAGENTDAGTVVGFLNARGITRLDAAIASHPHSDHIGSMDEVLNEIDTAVLVMPPVPEKSLPSGRNYENMMQAARDNGVTVREVDKGDRFSVGDIEMTVLSPSRTDYSDLNDFSLVIRAEFGDVSLLLTGDATTVAEKEMLADPWAKALLDCDLLKVGHHGGKTSTSAKFAAAVSPVKAFITGRADPEDADLSATVKQRLSDCGAEVYDTAASGRLLCYAEDNQLKVKEAKKQ